MQTFQNLMRQSAQMATQGRAKTKLGIVSSYDPNSYSAKVTLQPENIETGWLPVVAPWSGNGWGLFCPPTPGDLVEVQFQEDDIEGGFVCSRFFNDQDRPLPVPSGEFWLVHKGGSFLKFYNDGTVELVSAGTLTSSAPQWNHTGPLSVDGTLLVTETITGQGGMAVSGNNGSGAAMSISGNSEFTGQLTANGKRIDDTHTHNNVQPGSGTSGTVT